MLEPFSRMAFGAALLFALVASACAKVPVLEGQAILSSSLDADPTGRADFLIDFGSVAVGAGANASVRFTNEGGKLLTIFADRLQVPFTTEIPPSGARIPANGSVRLDFGFAPTEETSAPAETILEVSTNEEGGKTYTIRLQGHGLLHRLDCIPAGLDFGDVPIGLRHELSTVCTNPLPFAIEFAVGPLTGSSRQSFSVSAPDAAGSWTRLGSGKSETISVEFDAQSLGEQGAMLELTSSLGYRIAQLPLVANTVDSGLVMEPSGCLDFSYVGIGEWARRSLLLRNRGVSSVGLTSIEVSGDGPSNFSVVGPLLSSLAPGETAIVEIEFLPVAAGPQMIQILIEADEPGPGTRSLTACARGFGGGPSIACTPMDLDFGEVAAGMSSRASYRCINSGVGDPAGGPVDPLYVRDLRSDTPAFTARVVNDDGTAGIKGEGYRLQEGFGVEVTFAPEAEGLESGIISLDSTSAPYGSVDVRVAGQGLQLPPCSFGVAPSQLHFGVVGRGRELVLEFIVQNTGDGPCMIGDVRLEEGSDPAFALEPLESLTLLGGEALRIPVTLAPTTVSSRLEGAVIFQISNDGDRNQRVPLQGSSSATCLQLEPATLDFGAVGPGCQARERDLFVTNICGTPQTVTELAFDEGLDRESFQVGGPSDLPATLYPGHRAELSLRFSPPRAGSYAGSVEVRTGSSASYRAGLIGLSASDPIQIDTFEMRPPPKVDVLWVIQGSGSYGAYGDRIATNLRAFLGEADRRGIDYRIAMTTAELLPAGGACGGDEGGVPDGRFIPIDGSSPRILTPTTQNSANVWAHRWRNGPVCSSQGGSFEAARRALSAPLIDEIKSSNDLHVGNPWNDGNAGFLRREAALSIVFVSYDNDTSTSYGLSVWDYIEYFRRLKPRGDLRIHGITGGRPNGQSCTSGERFMLAIEGTEGSWMDICTPVNQYAAWESGLRELSKGVFGFEGRFILRGTPGDRNGDGVVDEEDIVLRVDGIVRPPLSSTKAVQWYFDPVSNSIEFGRLVSWDRSQIEAEYQVACGGS